MEYDGSLRVCGICNVCCCSSCCCASGPSNDGGSDGDGPNDGDGLDQFDATVGLVAGGAVTVAVTIEVSMTCPVFGSLWKPDELAFAELISILHKNA